MNNRTFIPGSEWVYFKIYTGIKTADNILKNELSDYVREMQINNIIDKWFFIRYTDPHFHIRLRLHLKDIKNYSIIFNRFFDYFQPTVNSELVWNIQCDTYQREIERYGTNTISIIEDLFFIDSESIINILQELDDDNPELKRWESALVIVDNYLSAFKIDLPQRLEFSKMNADKFKNEFGFIRHNETKQLNDKYRAYRKDIEYTMSKKNEIFKSNKAIKEQMQTFIPLIEKIAIMDKSGELQVTMVSLLSSLIHMSLDRLFRTKNRLHEMIIYEFLSKFYSSEIARNTHKSKI